MFYLYYPFTFTFSYYCFLFSCVHLLVHFWWTLIFQHQSLRRLISHCSKEPRKTTRCEYEVSYLLYIWHFVLLWWPNVKIISSFSSALLYFQSCIQTKTIVDVCLLCEIKYLLSFLYVCENLAQLLQRKIFTEEISLFVSIC